MLTYYLLILLSIQKPEEKTPDHAKYITPAESNKYSSEIFDLRLGKDKKSCSYWTAC